ncbi:MAG TPA: exodeoxyribonuclease VII large subunit [Gammaproteobacteria bacterium]|nr:exodeoxyribonuclease VII large subunit [Gammaproteobacteria bacterium]
MRSAPFQSELLVPARDVYTVSRLNREARGLLEGGFPLLWLEGELSNFARPSSGHCYFSLKDASAQVRCALFRQQSRALGFSPANGQHVLVRARVSLYESRGEFQLIVEHMEEAGEGALRRAFEALKQKLAAEGLFDTARKRSLPALPKRIGLITSPSGAAIRDLLHVLARRFPAIPVLIYPAPVQGAGAAARIAQAIDLASSRSDCDVLILARGGGSLEDLWAFNEEVVARAIHRCAIPLVSGVGHEIDFTIADFVADVRAPTPSAAAELVVPDGAEWLRSLRGCGTRLAQCAVRHIERLKERTAWVERRLAQQHPGQRLKQRMQRLDELELRLQQCRRVRFERFADCLRECAARLARLSPAPRIARDRQRVTALTAGLCSHARRSVSAQRDRLAAGIRALNAMSPLATLERGYAIVSRADGSVLLDAASVAPGETISARLARGSLGAIVKTVAPGGE